MILYKLKVGDSLNISVLGCGRWGSFIAWYLNKIGHNVMLWGRTGSVHLNELIKNRKNEFLNFDDKIQFTDSLKTALGFSDVIVVSISAQSFRDFFADVVKICDVSDKTFVLCMKGLEQSTGKRLSQIVQEIAGENQKVAVWVGPGHVQDFEKGIPNCMVIDSPFIEVKNRLVKEFSSSLIRFYYGTDMIGTEVGAAAKNVMGIAAGILDGMGFESLKGALMSRGTYEISKLISAMGGNAPSAYGLAHLGDYQATLFSQHSNNRLFGESLVKKSDCKKLAEGAMTSDALVKLGNDLNVDLPICAAVNKIVFGKLEPQQALKELFERSTQQEFN